MLRLKNRSGVFVVLAGLLITVLLAASAMSVDMSRIWSMRNELQTSADAAALVGAIQLTPPHLPGYAVDTATAFANRNKALYDPVTVDSVQTGTWDDDLVTFTAGGSPTNAIHVVVSHGTNKLLIGMLGVSAPRVKARATAWASAPVSQTNCVKPWAVPYVTLMSRINTARGITPANSNANLTRPWDQINDVAALNSMTEAERTFDLKQGTTGKVDDDAPGGAMPGNYHAVVLPRRWSNGVYNPDGAPSSGANRYRDNVQGPNCYSLSIGDSLDTEPGNKVGPTIQGVVADPGVCATLVGEDTSIPSSDPSYGNCLDADGNNGVTVKTGFYLCRTKCNGRTTVGVEMMGSFTIKKIYPDNSKNKDPVAFDKSEIIGVFNPITATGPVGSGPTTLSRLILVR